KCHMLFPGQANHDPQPVSHRDLEQPPGRNGICADGIDPQRCHLRKVTLDGGMVVVFIAGIVLSKGTISDAPNKKLFLPDKNVSSPDLGTNEIWRRDARLNGCRVVILAAHGESNR